MFTSGSSNCVKIDSKSALMLLPEFTSNFYEIFRKALIPAEKIEGFGVSQALENQLEFLV